MKKHPRALLAVTAAAASAALLLSGCSGGGGAGAASGDGAATADVAAAKAYIKPYMTPPTDLPVSEPLAKMPKAGSTVAFLDLGSPVAALMWDYLQPAAEALHVKLQRVQTGNDAQSINSALNSVVESKPDAVISVALDPAMFTPQLEQLQKAGTVFIPASIVNAEKFGFEDGLAGHASSIENGKVLAATMIAETEGKATDLVFYNVPEMPFSGVQLEGAKQMLGQICPQCNLRVVDVPIAQLGSTASQTVVSDLQAHPETQAFITALDEIQMGLPAAMDVAGIDVPGIGQSPSSANLEAVAAGDQYASFAVDFHEFMWILMDQAARGMAGQKYGLPDARTLNPMISQIIKKDNAPDPAKGFIALPDYQERFKELWTGGK